MKRLDYIDGLKGICAIHVCLLHFFLMFNLAGYIGWRCLPEAAADTTAYFIKWLPWSLLINTNFPLHLFFAIISFVICYLFLKNRDENKLKQKIILRYFRFMPVVLASCLVAYVLLKYGLCPLEQLYEITGNTWGYARLEESYTLADALKIGLFSSYFSGTQLVSPLWCMHYIFLGSVMTFFTMLVYGSVKNKALFLSLFIAVIFFTDQNYMSFAGGIIAALIINKEPHFSKTYGGIFILITLVLELFPVVLMPGFLNIATLYAIGSALIIVTVHVSFSNSRFLGNRLMVFLGKESLSLIIWQMLILQSLNVFLYNNFYYMGMGNTLNFAINLMINAVLSFIVTWISSKTITPFTDHLCRRVSTLLFR